MKTNAKDYLTEFIAKRNTPNWLIVLIQKTISTNGKIDKRNKDLIFKTLLIENNLKSTDKSFPVEAETIIKQENLPEISTEPLKLEKVTHQKGINALIPNQTITFSPNSTIIYGLNGTGKSGYFRIIHELAGGEKSQTILGNIRSPGEESIKVDVEYSFNDQQRSFSWEDKNNRGIYPFNQIKVFDSDYLPIFLSDRENAIDVEPLGLHLFDIIAKCIDEYKETLNQKKYQIELQIPDLTPLVSLLHSQELRCLLVKASLAREEKEKLAQYRSFSEKDSQNLDSLVKQKEGLEKNNNDASRKLLIKEKAEISNLKDGLNRLKTIIESINKKTSELVSNYNQKKAIRDTRKKEFEILNNIPSRDLIEWEAFIKAAEDYKDKIVETDFDKETRCIYCHQELKDNSLKLVQAYSQYQRDKSQQDLTTAKDNLSTYKNSVNNVSTNVSISDDLRVLLQSEKIEEYTLNSLIAQFIDRAANQKGNLISFLDNKTLPTQSAVLHLTIIDSRLLDLIEQKQKAIADIDQSEAVRNKRIEELKKQIHVLDDKKNIVAWKDKIDKFYESHQVLREYDKANSKISTRNITTLSSDAHNNLITKKLKQVFENELRYLGKENIGVELRKVSASKGKIKTRLEIISNNVQDILSEGEKKAVGLALFLAEATSQSNGGPIVFDDPVNSLDHEVRGFLAERLIDLSKDRQVIIFTHDLLFTSQLVKLGSSSKIDFTTHVIDRSSFEVIGRVSLDSSPKMANIKTLREKFTKSMKGYESLGFEEKEIRLASSFDYLRSACECLIEELLFAGTIQRYDDHIKVQNLEEAIFDKELAVKVVELHGKISESGLMHNQSDFQSQGHTYLAGFNDCKEKFEALHTELKSKRKENNRTREQSRKINKTLLSGNW